jgi:hypothetical protein
MTLIWVLRRTRVYANSSPSKAMNLPIFATRHSIRQRSSSTHGGTTGTFGHSGTYRPFYGG